MKRQREAFFQQPDRPVLEVTADPSFRTTVILGDPGSGKSALLGYLGLSWAELPPAARTEKPVPLLIELKTFVENFNRGITDFLDYFAKGTGTVSQFNPDPDPPQGRLL